ncbi:MAG: dockerin type I repeat-containing protein, partial [Ignavibacteriaceae bacterium]|nr:dockerin type I repeat-containing protein [Ignavibacteriaceae bacterium]
MNKVLTFLSAFILVVLLTSSNYATGLLTEDFNYTSGTLLSTTATTGWSAHSGAGTNAITINATGGASGLTYSGFAGSGVGLSVTLAASGEDDNKLLSSAVTSGSIYFSAMINVASVTTAGYFFNIGTSTTTFYARLSVQAVTGGYNFGIAKGSSDAAQYESTVRSFGTTYFVVVKYTFGSPSVIYVNPSPFSTEPGSPAAASLTATDISTITAIYIRQGSSGPILTIDGIRAGTTWADATPSSGGSPLFSTTGTLTSFSQTSSSASAEQTYTIGGTNLTNNVTVTPPAGFEISKTTGSGFVTGTGNLTFTAAQVMANPTIYVRLHASSSGSYSGNITHASSDFTTVDKAVSGTYPGFTVTGTLSAFSQTSATPSAEQTYTIGGTNLTNTVTVTPPAGFEISKTTGAGFVTSTGNLTFTAAQVMANPTIYVRLHAATPGTFPGNITHASSDFVTANQSVTGTYTNAYMLSLTGLIQARYNGGVFIPDSVSVELHDASSFALVDQDKELLSSAGTGTFKFYSAVNGTNYYIVVKHRNSIETWSASAQSFSSNLLSYNFTTSASQAYGSNLVLQSGKYCIYSGDVNQDGQVTSDDFTGVDNDNTNFDYHIANDLNGDGQVTSDDFTCIDNNNSNFISKNVPAVVPPTPVFSITGTLTSFSQTSSAPGTEQTYTISGSNLTSNVTLVPPASFEISKTTGAGFVTSTSSLVYTAAEVMAGKTIYVRLHAASTGSYSGNITHTSSNSEFTQAVQSVSGSYTSTPVF